MIRILSLRSAVNYADLQKGDRMFKHAGQEVMVFAKVWFVLGVIASIVCCVLFFVRGAIFTAVAILVGGIFSAWISSCVLHAIGQSAEDNKKILEYIRIENKARLAQFEQEQKAKPVPQQRQQRFQQRQ